MALSKMIHIEHKNIADYKENLSILMNESDKLAKTVGTSQAFKKDALMIKKSLAHFISTIDKDTPQLRKDHWQAISVLCNNCHIKYN